jgi:serine protease
MKRFLTSLLLTSLLWQSAGSVGIGESAIAQTQPPQDLYYTFYGQRIPLAVRPNQIAVAFTPVPAGARGAIPGFVQLQQALRGEISGTRSGAAAPALNVQVQPLGSRYALIELPDSSPELQSALQERLQQPYIEATLPVLTRPKAEDTIVLPNQILVSFADGISESQRLLVLSRYNLEIVRPLRFSPNQYLVRLRQANPGLSILQAANQLNGVPGIQSASPNFVQTVALNAQPFNLSDRTLTEGFQPANFPDRLLAHLPNVTHSLFPTRLFPLHWHLDSTPLRGRLQPRTDLQVPGAWEAGVQGENVVVAVIDSLIQWNHPDLAGNLYQVPETVPDRLPGEVHGWDFSSNTIACNAQDDCVTGDPDTRLSAEELQILRPHFQRSFMAADADILREYSSMAERIQSAMPELSRRQVANLIRRWIQQDIAAEFHGTWSAGVVAAQPHSDQGVIGVAPKAQILPVRVFGLGGEITPAALVEAIGYAAARDVDVINLSLGGLLPNRELTDQIFAVQNGNPHLVMVASAGNDSFDGVAFPAAIPGVLSVGATTLEGQRTAYSSYGGRLDVVAPGGDTSVTGSRGILTTGGTWLPEFWQGMPDLSLAWGYALDPLGQYVQVQGTSFSAPAVSGVVALMQSANPNRRLTRDQVLHIVRSTASHEGLQISQADLNQYRLQAAVGFNQGLYDLSRASGIFAVPQPVSPEQYFFGGGLVNATAAVSAAQRQGR